MIRNRQKITIDYIKDENIFRIADNFLNKYNPNLIIPVPIEKIAESKLNITILSINDLRTIIDSDGFFTSDFKTITLDDYIYNNFIERTNFTIAHELGHLFLHKQLYQSQNITSLNDVIRFQNQIDTRCFNRLEIQANIFASRVIFPKRKLDEMIISNLKRCGGVKKFTLLHLRMLIDEMQKSFLASDRCCTIQLEKSYPKLLAIANNYPF